MNPLFFFDEVTRWPDTPKGEVAQVLMFDRRDAEPSTGTWAPRPGRSRSVFIFSFNDRTWWTSSSQRMTIVETSGVRHSKQKASIMKRHAIPEILRDFLCPRITAQLVSDSFVAALVPCGGDEGMWPPRGALTTLAPNSNVQAAERSTRTDARCWHPRSSSSTFDPSLSMMYNPEGAP
jgi:hypothetical protein